MKIRVSNVGYALLQGRIYRPHYLDPQNGIIHLPGSRYSEVLQCG